MKAGRNNAASGAGEARASAPDSLDYLLEGNPKVEDICRELARIFGVGTNEIALYQFDKGFLKFLYPRELGAVGQIPLSGSAVSAHTANARKPELFNNFIKVKHASVFEHIKIGAGQEQLPDQLPIQKLMSAPILGEGETVLGVIQVSHKGVDSSCAPDFKLENLRHLELAAKVIGRANFMKIAHK